MKKNINLEKLKQAEKLERKLKQINNLEPSNEWWEIFAVYQIKKMEHFASVRDTGESIQGTYKDLKS